MIPISDAIPILGLTRQRIAVLCAAGRIKGARFIGRQWFLPRRPVITPVQRGKHGGKLAGADR